LSYLLEMKHVLDRTLDDLAADVAALGGERYRARQIGEWVWHKQATAFAEMTDLPAALRSRLEAEGWRLRAGRAVEAATAPDGTVKCLLELADGERVECVGIPAGRRLTACVSTQVGCAMGCAFCATGVNGLERNLTAGEIVEQVFHLQESTGARVTNVVFMGMGEPLANYDATVAAVRALTDPARLGLSARHVTVSTVGLPKAIRRLAAEHMPITLALSLHAPTDALRRELIPAAARFPLAEVLSAAEAFYQSRKREVTLEYVLLSAVNDTPACADALAAIAHRLRCNVNLIRYNPVPSLPFRRPGKRAVEAFVARLRRRNVNTHVRRSRGLEVAAACGQLRYTNRREPTK